MKDIALQQLVHQDEPLTRAGTSGSYLGKCLLIRVHCSHLEFASKESVQHIVRQLQVQTNTHTHTHTRPHEPTHTHTHTHPHTHARTRAQTKVPSQSLDSGQVGALIFSSRGGSLTRARPQVGAPISTQHHCSVSSSKEAQKLRPSG